jgi:hypothetical protein
MIQVLLMAIVLVGLAFAGIAIKILVKKGGQFTKSCSSVDAVSGEKIGCVCEGQNPQNCVNIEKHHGDAQ